MATTTQVEKKHAFFMSQAYEESLKGRFLAPPNPWVGCVIVKHGKIIARGHHLGPRTDHAEIMALKEAQEEAKESTMFVTLEPCPNHGATPPCTDAIIKSGVKKVIIGTLDPDSRVSGRGVDQLQRAGIEVEVGLLDEKIKQSLTSYCHHRKTNLPFCLLKAAISMDGKIAAKDGSSIWITGNQARRDVHRERAQSQAIIVGTNTAIEDDPQLTVRTFSQPFKPPLRVVLDRKGRVEPKGDLFDVRLAPTLIATSKLAPQKRIDKWKMIGCEVVELPLLENKQLDLRKLLEFLGKKGVLQVMVEGGSKVFSSLISQKLADRLILYMGSCLLGAEGVSLFSQPELENIDDAIRMNLKDFNQLGKDARLDYNFK